MLLKGYFRSLEEVSASEWLLGMMIMVLSAMLSLVCIDDEKNSHLSPIFAGQAFYYAFCSIVPVCAFLRDRMEQEFPEEEGPEAASAEA